MRKTSMLVLFSAFLAFVSVQPAFSQCPAWATSGNDISFDCSGNVGIGTGSPDMKLHIFGDAKISSAYPILYMVPTAWGSPAWIQAGVDANFGAAGDYLGFRVPTNKFFLFNNGVTFKGAITNESGVLQLQRNMTDNAARRNWSLQTETILGDFAILESSSNTTSPNTARLTIRSGGNVGIGTTSPQATLDVAGSIRASGSITGATVIGAVFQDLAEWVPAAEDLQAGTVVVLSASRSNEVTASTKSYDTRVAGVVSAQPGLLLGVEGTTKEMIATTGRVRVLVDASAAPIAIGDLLVTSDRGGRAMKSIPRSVDGVAMHRPGTIIGKALEPLDDGTGEILVLLSMQ